VGPVPLLRNELWFRVSLRGLLRDVLGDRSCLLQPQLSVSLHEVKLSASVGFLANSLLTDPSPRTLLLTPAVDGRRHLVAASEERRLRRDVLVTRVVRIRMHGLQVYQVAF